MQVVNLETLLKEGRITSKTFDRVNIAKSYIEKKYSLKKTKEESKRKGTSSLYNTLNRLRLGCY
jgi:hypothetical protein